MENDALTALRDAYRYWSLQLDSPEPIVRDLAGRSLATVLRRADAVRANADDVTDPTGAYWTGGDACETL